VFDDVEALQYAPEISATSDARPATIHDIVLQVIPAKQSNGFPAI